MKLFNRLVAIVLLSAMVLSLVACSGSDTGNKKKPSESTTFPFFDDDSSDRDRTDYYVLPAPYERPDDGLTDIQRNSINMLNYMLMISQKVNVDRKNQLALESAYDSFDNLYPNSVDRNTQAQITSLMDTIQGYRMISVKRDRLEYIYEQNQAQAYRKAIPNPMGLLSAVQSGSKIKMAAAVFYMVVDSASSYEAARSQADLDFLKEGWELDDAESEELHNSTKNSMNYMFDMVRTYDIPGDYALSKVAIEDFVSWSSKPDTELDRKIMWFEDNEKTYALFGPYWLELARDYYLARKYDKCLESVLHYESISTRIFRKDKDYASVLPMAIISAREIMSEEDYIELASKYCELIHENTQDKDWSLRYFSVMVYMDLYSKTNDKTYLDKAYACARENVNYLVDEQKKLNIDYISDIEELTADAGATKRVKDEIKQYNKSLRAERKIALPPVSEALYLNVEVLFGLANEMNISSAEKQKIDSILHANGESIFLTKALDDRFWFTKTMESLKAEDIDVEFDGSKLVIPASCITDRSKIVVTVSGPNGTATFEEWEVVEVKRPKNSTDCSEYKVTLKIKEADKYKYQAGETISINVLPVEDNENEYLTFNFNVIENNVAFVKGIKFERVT